MMELTEVELFRMHLDALFYERLGRITGWGKNEVYQQFKEAVKDAEIEVLKARLEKVGR